MNHLYIFVEGARDRIVFDNLFGKKLSLLGQEYDIVEYSTKKVEKINNFIKSIKSIDGCDYIFVGDQDGNINKKAKILSKYSCLEEEKIFISIFEIESWIISGISNKILKKYKIKFSYTDTSAITKEMFENIVPEHVSVLEFISYIIDDFDVDKSLELNSSFNQLYNYLNAKKAS